MPKTTRIQNSKNKNQIIDEIIDIFDNISVTNLGISKNLLKKSNQISLNSESQP